MPVRTIAATGQARGAVGRWIHMVAVVVAPIAPVVAVVRPGAAPDRG